MTDKTTDITKLLKARYIEGRGCITSGGLKDELIAAVAEIERLRRSRLPKLQVGNLRIGLCDDPDAIAIDRDGEGGHFSLQEFHDMLQGFVSDRL